MFRFSLEAVLRFRRSTEERERLRLHGLQQELRDVVHETRRLLEAAAQERANARRAAEEGLFAAELLLRERYAESLDAMRALQLRRTEELEHECVRQIDNLRRERRKRETLERLRANQEERFRRAEKRAEQSRLDENYLLQIR